MRIERTAEIGESAAHRMRDILRIEYKIKATPRKVEASGEHTGWAVDIQAKHNHLNPATIRQVSEDVAKHVIALPNFKDKLRAFMDVSTGTMNFHHIKQEQK